MIPLGVVHRGEYVLTKEATRRIGVRNLDALQQGALKGYADGGLVTEAPAIRSANIQSMTSSKPTQEIQINAPITVNGSAGTPEQNTDLAQKMAKEMERNVKGLVADEMRKQTRPGNFLGGVGRRG
nr:hypothetical protein [uncultured Cohaesibacter sp.]